MGLYRLDRSYAGVELLAYPALYHDVWSLSSQEIKMILANEVGLTARGCETNAFDLVRILMPLYTLMIEPMLMIFNRA